VLHESREEEEEEEEEEETKTEEGEEKPAKPRTKADGRGAPSPEPSGGEATRGDADAKGEQAAHVAFGTTDTGLAALAVPDILWEYLDDATRQKVPVEILKAAYEARTEYARRIAWRFASDFELLGIIKEDNRPTIAESLIKIRAGLDERQIERAAQDVEVQKKVVVLLDEFHQQAQKWTRLAEFGVWLLIACLAFTMAMTGWLISIAADKQISGWSLPAAIFALALFAASPAVLLLRERPLKGMDEWMPGAEPSKSSHGDAAGKGTRDRPPPRSSRNPSKESSTAVR
jgi:hypothetical protein